MFHIEIIGAIDNQQHYSVDEIQNIILLDAETLTIGNNFVGRPSTQIHANETAVIKIRTELCFNNKEKSRDWIKQALTKEQQLAVHHPHKTWLLISQQDKFQTESIAIANICPRLQPLHIELKATPHSSSERQKNLKLLTNVFRMYLTLAKNSNYKLDEGLSNFAVSNEGIVYYLDDEYYQWDKFVSFATMLGVYIRTFEWLDDNFIAELGEILCELLDDIFHDEHCHIIIARQLRILFMPIGQKEHLLHTLIQKIKPQKVKHYNQLNIYGYLS